MSTRKTWLVMPAGRGWLRAKEPMHVATVPNYFDALHAATPVLGIEPHEMHAFITDAEAIKHVRQLLGKAEDE